MDKDLLIKLAGHDRFATHVGIEVVDAGPGFAKTRVRIEEHHLNGLGVVQGGVIFTLADLAFALAGNAHGRKMTGLNTHVTFISAAGRGDLTADAEEVSCSGRVATYDVTVRDDSGTLIATFQGTGYRLKDSWDEEALAEGRMP